MYEKIVAAAPVQGDFAANVGGFDIPWDAGFIQSVLDLLNAGNGTALKSYDAAGGFYAIAFDEKRNVFMALTLEPKLTP